MHDPDGGAGGRRGTGCPDPDRPPRRQRHAAGARRARPRGPRRRGGGALRGRPRSRHRLPGPPRPHGGALRPGPTGRREDPVPHRRPGVLGRVGGPDVPRPVRRPGEDTRIPRRTRRGHTDAGRPAGRRRSGRPGPPRPSGRGPAGRLRRARHGDGTGAGDRRPAHGGTGRAAPRPPGAARLGGPAGPPAVRQRKAGPGRAARALSDHRGGGPRAVRAGEDRRSRAGGGRRGAAAGAVGRGVRDRRRHARRRSLLLRSRRPLHHGHPPGQQRAGGVRQGVPRRPLLRGTHVARDGGVPRQGRGRDAVRGRARTGGERGWHRGRCPRPCAGHRPAERLHHPPPDPSPAPDLQRGDAADPHGSARRTGSALGSDSAGGTARGVAHPPGGERGDAGVAAGSAAPPACRTARGGPARALRLGGGRRGGGGARGGEDGSRSLRHPDRTRSGLPPAAHGKRPLGAALRPAPRDLRRLVGHHPAARTRRAVPGSGHRGAARPGRKRASARRVRTLAARAEPYAGQGPPGRLLGAGARRRALLPVAAPGPAPPGGAERGGRRRAVHGGARRARKRGDTGAPAPHDTFRGDRGGHGPPGRQGDG